MNRRLDEATKRIYRTLLERFGEPIDRVTATVGITDDRSGKVATRGESEEGEQGDDLLLDEEDGPVQTGFLSWLHQAAKAAGKKSNELDGMDARNAFRAGEDPEAYGSKATLGRIG